MTLAKSISRSIWASERFPGGSGLWRGGLWTSQQIASVFTPAELFSAGQQGAWYEPKPEYLYQDSNGTTSVTADGQPVGYMQDLSGNGNHATQATAAAKPIYRTDGTLHWLEFDMVDDFLQTAAFSTPMAQPATWVVGLSDPTPEGVYFSGLSAQARHQFYVSSTGTPVISIFSGAQLNSNGVKPLPETVYSLKYNGVSSLIRRNAVDLATGDAGTQSAGGIALGSFAGGASPSSVEFRGLIVVGEDLLENLSQAESYIATLAGVTL